MVEFRLYYDDNGRVICYTCDDLPGDNYIVIDSGTYAQSRPDVRVVDGKVRQDSDYIVLSTMVMSTTGTKCDVNDICVITDESPNNTWEMITNEFRLD
jgi:hypothetical protein